MEIGALLCKIRVVSVCFEACQGGTCSMFGLAENNNNCQLIWLCSICNRQLWRVLCTRNLKTIYYFADSCTNNFNSSRLPYASATFQK